MVLFGYLLEYHKGYPVVFLFVFYFSLTKVLLS